ncbi:MAG: methyltransferase domain-containing protein, partial [Chitinivibrionales bacterium]|nr:methyltransferase domain-containing protein [Chitinivibrionales bacterium]
MSEPGTIAFAGKKHQRGEWNTRISPGLNPFVRSLWCFISFKREGVDRIAQSARIDSRILDCGSGNCAYAHWVLGRKNCTVVAVDWSIVALRSCRKPARGRLLRVCADMNILPFKQQTFQLLYSIDALGHLDSPIDALDQIRRVAKPGALLFIHSECSDYRKRWPDRQLIRIHGEDIPAGLDG